MTTNTASRNPAWQRDELILALDLYFRHPPKSISQTDPEVVAVSDLLNALPIHADRADGEKFRNPNGVYMKLCNFLRFDPSYHGVGLSRGNKLEEVVWNEFASDQAALRAMAQAIGEGYKSVQESEPEIEDEMEFPEGRILYRMHRQRERNKELVKKKKAMAQSVACEVCNFNFGEVYGEVGTGFIECHHTKPISEYSLGQRTTLDDLALVCANCHRMLHRKRPWLCVEDLRNLLTPRSS